MFSLKLPRVLLGLGFFVAINLCSSGASAQLSFAGSAETTLALGAMDLVSADEQVAVDDGAGVVMLESLGALPFGADLNAYGVDANGDRFLSFDTTVMLSNGLVARPGDVVRFDGINYSIEFDAILEGVSPGTRVDAVSSAPVGLLLSFDTTVALPGGLTVADEDLVDWDGSSFALSFDGSAAGIPVAADVDAAQDLGSGRYALSLDTTGSVGGVVFDDEDVLEYANGIWSLLFDSSSLDDDWAATDLDAVFVPEPAFVPSLGMAVGLVFLLYGRELATRSRRGGRDLRRAVLVMRAVQLAVPSILLATANAANAQDGVLEINAVCAVETGCFPGDTPGYPVSLLESGSYRLTSTLFISSTASFRAGIFVGADDVEIDLAGFGILGDGGSTVSLFEGNGIYTLTAKRVGVRNGFVSSMRANGILLDDESWVEDVSVYNNAMDGISVGDRSRVQYSLSFESGDDGIVVGDYSVVDENVVQFATDHGIVIGSGSRATANAVTNADGFGLVILAPNDTAGYGRNVFRGNNGPVSAPQISVASGTAVEVAPNVCGSDAICP